MDSNLVAGSITGLVMAGGRSRRMGEDKAGLQLKDKTFLQAALDDVHRVCEHVVVALNTRQSFDLPDWCQRLDDKHDYAGPVQALLDAAEQVAGDFLLVRAVDMPYADSAMLTQQSMPEHVDARMVEVAGRIQPLISLYRRQALLQLAACRPRRMMDVVAAMPVERIKMDGADWVNVNQQQDYDVLRSRA